MRETSFPARLHVLVAKDNKTTIVIRRGPSKQTCVLSWDITNDKIAVSQWLKGRIYERRSDISPDGKYWIYFAMNGKWASPIKGSWTAIAPVPWLKAVSLFAKGDCWNGGGLFLGNRSYWLNDGCGHEALTTSSELSRIAVHESLEYYGGECLTVYYNRLQRDGWILKQREQSGRHDIRSIFEKQLSRGWTLRKICHEQTGAPKGKGCYWDEHVLISKTGDEIEFPDWEWAEWLEGYVAFAKGGCLFRLQLKNGSKLFEGLLIHDFNGYKFEELEAPY